MDLTKNEIDMLILCLTHAMVVEKKNGRQDSEVYQFAKEKIEELRCKK